MSIQKTISKSKKSTHHFSPKLNFTWRIMWCYLILGNQLLNLIPRDWLGNIIIHSSIQSLLLLWAFSMSSTCNNRASHFREFLKVLFHTLHSLIPVHNRHITIQENQLKGYTSRGTNLFTSILQRTEGLPTIKSRQTSQA